MTTHLLEEHLVGGERVGGGLSQRIAGALADGLDRLAVLAAEVHGPRVEGVAAVVLEAPLAVERPVDEGGQLIRVFDFERVEVRAVRAGEEAGLAFGVEEAQAAEAGLGEAGGEDALAGAGGAPHGYDEAPPLGAAAQRVDPVRYGHDIT